MHSKISTQEDARRALRFILGTYCRAEVPVLLSIDEFERFALTADGQSDSAARGFLKDTAEIVTGGKHLFVLAGVTEAWNKMTKDVFGRIPQTDIVEIALDDDETEEVIKVWQRDPRPIFNAGTLRVLSEASNNNARRVLEIAHHCWNRWMPPAKLTVAEVRAAARDAFGDVSRKQKAKAQIQSTAEANRLIAKADPDFPDYDFVIASDGKPVAFTKVTTSVFRDDEVEDVRKIVAARKRVMTGSLGATCTVIAGYSHPSILSELRGTGDYVIQYEEASFARDYGEFLRIAQLAGAEHARTDLAESATYDTLQQTLESVAKSNERALAEIRQSIASLEERQRGQLQEHITEASETKQTDIIQQLVSLLNEEDQHVQRLPDSLLGRDGKFLDLIRRQISLVRYAQFLERIAPEGASASSGYWAEYLDALERILIRGDGLEKNIVAFEYSRRLDALREIRRNNTDQRTFLVKLRPLANLKNSLILLGAIGIVIYISVLVGAYISDSRVLASYRHQLQALRNFGMEYQSLPPSVLKGADTEYRSIVGSFLNVRSEIHGTSFSSLLAKKTLSISFGQDRDLDQVFSKVGRFFACGASPEECWSSSKMSSNLEALVTLSDEDLGRVQFASFAAFLISYVAHSVAWLVAAFVPLEIGILLAVMRRGKQSRFR